MPFHILSPHRRNLCSLLLPGLCSWTRGSGCCLHTAGSTEGTLRRGITGARGPQRTRGHGLNLSPPRHWTAPAPGVRWTRRAEPPLVLGGHSLTGLVWAQGGGPSLPAGLNDAKAESHRGRAAHSSVHISCQPPDKLHKPRAPTAQSALRGEGQDPRRISQSCVPSGGS